MRRKEMIISGLERVAKHNKDGFTYNIGTFRPVTSGFSVGYKETQDSFGRKGLENVLNFAQSIGSQTVGGWLDTETGEYYFDCVKIFKNRDEAISFGIDNQQLAVFDIDNCVEIRLLDAK